MILVECEGLGWFNLIMLLVLEGLIFRLRIGRFDIPIVAYLNIAIRFTS